MVIRSTWDYTERPAQFADWTRRVERTSTLFNPAAVVGWNIDKQYLRDLENAGLPIVPTIWLDPERNFDSRAIHTRFPAFGDFVVKPTVSAGSRDTGRYNAGVTQQRSMAITHAKNLLGVGRRVMIQRYLRNVDTAGETALVYVDGEFSHSVRKGALLDGPYRERLTDELYRQEIMTARAASDAERALADRVVAALPDVVPGADGPLLYARVDLIPDDDGAPVVLEVELTEPSLFFAHAEGSARAVRRRDRRAPLSCSTGPACGPMREHRGRSGTLLDAPAYASGDRGGYSSGGRAPGCGPGGRGFKSR